MSVFTPHPTNRLFKTTSIRTGRTAVRHDLLDYGPSFDRASQTVVDFLLRGSAILGLFFAVFLLFQPPTPDLIAQDQDTILISASISTTNGASSIERGDGRIESIAVGIPSTISAGDMIIAEDGIVELEFAHGQVVILEPGASVTIERLELKEGIQRTQLVVWSGAVRYFTAGELAAQDYFYVSSTSSASRVDDGAMYMNVISPVKTIYNVIDGIATIQMGTQTLRLQPKQKLIATLGDPLAIGMDTTQNTEKIDSSGTSTLLTAKQSAPHKYSAPVQTHEVQAGDTLWSIAQSHKMDIDTILLANPSIADAEFLQIGQQIYIPTDFAVTTRIAQTN